MINVACVLSITKGPLKGKRVCVVTDAGGPGVMMSDELNRRGRVWRCPLLAEGDRIPLTVFAEIGAGADLVSARAGTETAPAPHVAHFLPGGGEILLLKAGEISGQYGVRAATGQKTGIDVKEVFHDGCQCS
jgi:hypothetical protein